MKYTLVFDLDDTVINVPSKYNLDGILGMELEDANTSYNIRKK